MICVHGFNSETSHCAKCDNELLISDKARLQETLDRIRELASDMYAMRGEDKLIETNCNRIMALVDRGL